MFCKTSKCVLMVCGVLAVVGLIEGPSASADGKKGDKDKAAPSGAWVRKEGELKIEFDGKDALKIRPHGDNNKIAIVCNYTVEKDGRIKVKVADYEGDENSIEAVKGHVPPGLVFSFKWAVQDKSAKLDDLKGKGDIEGLKNHLEGDYEKK